ncbi:MAG: NUDIX domain-containing protein [Caldilineaceae bacterium]|nr:NUDIX domain-containing protein [Caldilineaceae bacterium]
MTRAEVVRPYIGIGVIIQRDKRILLGKRKGAHGEGCWQFPGGHLEFFEEIETCARREVLEETGLHIANLRAGPFTNDLFVAEGKHYVTLFVLADYVDGEAQVLEPHKCTQWSWFAWADLPSPLFLPIANLQTQGFSL